MSMPLLFEYFQELPQRREQETAREWSRRFRAGLKQFQKIVAGRYSEGTLQRLLSSATPAVRQAAVVALGLCGSMRGSSLMGSRRGLAMFQQAISDPANLPPAGSQLTPTSGVSSAPRGLAVAELEVGVQYRFNLWSPEPGRSGSGPALLVRFSAVSQTYFDAGNATSSNGSLSLFGSRFLAGLSY